MISIIKEIIMNQDLDNVTKKLIDKFLSEVKESDKCIVIKSKKKWSILITNPLIISHRKDESKYQIGWKDDSSPNVEIVNKSIVRKKEKLYLVQYKNKRTVNESPYKRVIGNNQELIEKFFKDKEHYILMHLKSTTDVYKEEKATMQYIEVDFFGGFSFIR